MKITGLFILTAVLTVVACDREVDKGHPNILLMMVDDLGFSDFGCYGSEIRTPHIDELAQNGLRFTQFYNTAKCHSSRVSLLTGLYCSQAGDQSLSRATTIAEVLGEAGYFTTMTGKWHLEREPTDFGFQRYWGHLSGSTDYFLGDSTFRLNGEPWNEFVTGFYTTDANVDFSLQFLDEAIESGKPFFHYIAFNAPHYPLQAPREDIQKYMDTYGKGWDRIRMERFEKQKQLGIFSKSVQLPPLPAHMTPWDSLDTDQQEFESFRMGVYAAMVDRLDQNIGRLLTYLKERDVLNHTLIMLCSDNGGCPFERSRHMEIPPWEGGSFYLYDASWATISNTPLRHYKQTQHEGGISSPLIVHWPDKVAGKGHWVRTPGHLIDLMATCIDVAGAKYPLEDGIEPLQGKSLLPLFRREGREDHKELYFTFSTNHALRQGDWKLVSFYGSRWELYNLADDRCEQYDLADQYPERVRAMSQRWYKLAEEKDRLPEKWRTPVKDQPSPNTRSEWHRPELVDHWKPFQ